MSKLQRLRVCLNLLQMEETTKSNAAREMYRQQYEMLMNKIEKGE
ncbi:hypothetical protein [Paenibacillus dendritiformis]|nr:hypothetical protein [Paenibacillus dendritiformis]